jgi:predicted RNA-binding Zn-ribbon protein involved in translation (DUF1610 family)
MCEEGAGMPLIDCTECGKQVSDKAASCPHCGNPMVAKTNGVQVETRAGSTVATEATGKTYKLWQAVGAGVFLLGLVSCAYVGGLSAGPIALIFIGSAIYIAAGIGAWWKHG